MGTISIDLFTTLDFVAQSPGRPDEGTEGGFIFGGWQVPFQDELVGKIVRENIQEMDVLLLGRKTYDIFASYWPKQTDDFAGGIAGRLNSIPKYVASRQPLSLEWSGSSQLEANTAEAVRLIRDRHQHVHVIGSLEFVQTLLAERLYDRLNLIVYPITLGTGKRVFAEGTIPANMRLAEPVVSTPNGIVILRYEPLDGSPVSTAIDVGA